MKTILTLALLLGFNAMAEVGDPVSLDCKPVAPCAYANDGMNKCVSSIQINGREGGRATETIKYRPTNIGFEVLLMPDSYQVLVGTSEEGLSFHDRTGDQYGDLHHIPGGKLKGSITVDQDFEFEVTCSNRAIGFE